MGLRGQKQYVGSGAAAQQLRGLAQKLQGLVRPPLLELPAGLQDKLPVFFFQIALYFYLGGFVLGFG